MLPRRQLYEKRLEQLRTERYTWESTWRDIAEQIIPYRAVWDTNVSQRNRGDRRDFKILNSKPLLALKALAAALMAGITSPAREWFDLKPQDPELAEYKPVQEYLDTARRRIFGAFASSNLYKALSSGTYLDLPAIGTGPMIGESGAPGHLRFTSMAIGEYCLDINEEGRVDTCYRELPRTTRQIVEKFGLEVCPANLQNQYRQGDYNQVWVVVHAIQPNELFDASLPMEPVVNKSFASVWWLKADSRPNAFLRESGYDGFPVFAPRWSALSSEAYGRGPGWDVRGDCRELQFFEDRLLKLVDKMVDPPMRAIGAVKGASLRAGDVTHLAAKGNAQALFEPSMQIPPAAIEVLKAHIQRKEYQISEGFYGHLLQMLIDDERSQRPTATEVEAKRQEAALQLGPLLENLNAELLEPLVSRSYSVLEANDMLPLAPPEMHGQQVKIEFQSIMHQMQQQTGLVGLQTLMTEIQRIAQTNADVIDKVDADAIVDELGRITGVRPKVIRSKDAVDSIRKARAQQEQAKQTGDAMVQAARGARDASATDVSKLSELAGAISPAAAAQGGALGAVGAG